MKPVIIAEKPEAANRIYAILSKKWPVEVKAAKGHLMQLWIRGIDSARHISQLPLTEVYWRIPKVCKKILEDIRASVLVATNTIIATDFDREGEVIGYNVYRYVLNPRRYYPLYDVDPGRIRRMYFSALIESEIMYAFQNTEQMNEKLLAQGLGRNLADTLFGLNITKAITIRFKRIYPKLTQAVSLGRVQSPVLVYIRDQIKAGIKVSGPHFFDDRDTAYEYYVEVDGGHYRLDMPEGINVDDDYVEVLDVRKEIREEQQSKPFFNTDEILQVSPLSPEVTMQVLEGLYLKGYATYPRTSSRFVPPSFLNNIIERMRAYDILPEEFSAEYLHPESREQTDKKMAIVLTPEGIDAYANNRLSGREKILATIILERMILALAPPLRIESVYINIRIGDVIHEVLWSENIANPEVCCDTRFIELRPSISPGKYPLVKIAKRQHEKTVFSVLSRDISIVSDKAIVGWMTEKNLGTEATRYHYPALLRERHYITDENLTTLLGEKIAEIIGRIGISVDITREVENRLNSIEKLGDIEDFKEFIVGVTKEYVETLSEISDSELRFICPECGEDLQLANTRYGLIAYCQQCRKFFPV